MIKKIGFSVFISALFCLSIETVFANQLPDLKRAPRFSGADNTGLETHRILIENQVSGNIFISQDKGKTWHKIGEVILPNNGTIHEIQEHQFTASDWAPVSSIAAVAVNAIHVKTAQREIHANVFSILPLELQERLPSSSYRDEQTTIFTDIPAGTGIFSAPLSPRVGDGLFQYNPQTKKIVAWPTDRAPQVGDQLVVVSRQKPKIPDYIEFENCFGGRVIWVKGEDKQVIARVFRPSNGTGRFSGGIFQGVGKLRANHPGVICISTSPLGEMGGLQIVPDYHATNPSLTYLFDTTAYMIVGPLTYDVPKFEGTFPLFSGLFRPGDRVDARIKGVWGGMPTVVGKAIKGLSQVEAFRIYPSLN